MNNNSRCIRIDVTTTNDSFVVPSFARYMVIKNAGSIGMQFNFEVDDNDQFYSLSSGEVSPIMGVLGGDIVNIVGLGDTTLEALVWL